MTEQDAKKKLCPFEYPNVIRCAGTGCMAFQFEIALFWQSTGKKVEDQEGSKFGATERRSDPEGGYCVRLVRNADVH